MKIVAIDEAVIRYAPEAVKRVLLDVAAYPQWWRQPFRVDVPPGQPQGPGASYRVTAGRLRWQATITAVEPSRIQLAYDHGSWRGTAKWDLHPALEGTRLVHRMDVEPVSLWLKLAARFRPLDKRHARQTHKLFDAISARLHALGEPLVPEPVGPPGTLIPPSGVPLTPPRR